MIDIGIAVKNIVAIPQKYVLPESTCSLLPFSDETARAAQSSVIVPARICIGNRIVIVTAYGIIHDFRVDGTLKNGARDVGAVCNNFNAAIHFNEEDVMVFRLFNLFDTVFREIRNEEMIFTFIDGIETSTKRICQYPEEK